MLFQMQLLLSEGATDAFEAAHSSTAAALSGAQLPPPLSAELRLHCAALHAVYLLRQGRTVGLGPPGEPVIASAGLFDRFVPRSLPTLIPCMQPLHWLQIPYRLDW